MTQEVFLRVFKAQARDYEAGNFALSVSDHCFVSFWKDETDPGR